MTRLTEYHRSALAHCIMNDTPFPTAKELKAQAQALLYEAMPEDMRAAAQAHPEWMQNTSGRYVTYQVHQVTQHTGSLVLAGLTNEQTTAALKPLTEQIEHREKLKEEVTSALKAFSTVKALLKAMPEMEKYVSHLALPASTNLPAVTNVVAKLSEAGWPKDKVAA